jgi:hypothetical protein
MVAFARFRKFSVTADGASNFTGWLSAKHGIIATLSGTFVGTATIQRRAADGTVYDFTNNAGAVQTMTAPGNYLIDPTEVSADWRLCMKSGAYTSGTCNMMIEGR